MNSKLLLQKLSITDAIVEQVKSLITVKDIKTIGVMFFNSRKIVKLLEKEFPNAEIFFIDEEIICTMYPGKNTITTDYTLRGLQDMHFDLVIANAPYGKVAPEIIQTIVDDVDFKEFINLLPFNYYIRVKNLWKHVDINSIICMRGLFVDASTIPYLVRITKEECNSLDKEEFRMKFRPDCLKKFYEQNLKRNHYAVDAFISETTPSLNDDYCNTKDFLITTRAACDGVHNSYCDGTPNEALDRSWNLFKTKNMSNIDSNVYRWSWLRFNTTVEFDNFCKLWYEGEKDGIMDKLLRGLAHQGSCALAIPKIDWTKSWTWEEIFKKEYGYTDEEWQAVLDYKSINLA